MSPKVELYLDIDDVVYGKDIEKEGRMVRRGHLTFDVISAGVRPGQVANSLKRRKHKIIRTGVAAIGLLFSLFANHKKGNFRISQYMLEMLLKNSSKEDLEYLVKLGAEQSLRRKERVNLENKIYSLKPLLEQYPEMEIKVNYISLESKRLQEIVAKKSGVDVKQFYQTGSTYQKVNFVKKLANKNPDTTYILVDDDIKPNTRSNSILINDIHKLPKVLYEVNCSYKEILKPTYTEVPEGKKEGYLVQRSQ